MIRGVFARIFEEIPAEFAAAGTPAEAAERLRRVVVTGLASPFRTCLLGVVGAGYVRFERQLDWSRNLFGPAFEGAFVAGEGGTRLRGAFSIGWAGKLLLLLWPTATTLGSIWMLGAAVGSALGEGGPAALSPILLLLGAVGVLALGLLTGPFATRAWTTAREQIPAIRAEVASALIAPTPPQPATEPAPTDGSPPTLLSPG